MKFLLKCFVGACGIAMKGRGKALGCGYLVPILVWAKIMFESSACT